VTLRRALPAVALAPAPTRLAGVMAALVLAAVGATAPLSAATVEVTVSPTAKRRPINPLIYGVNFADPARLAAVPYPLNRWGGNATTRYNWRVDVNNTASDWFYMNVPTGPADVSRLPHGSAADRFVAATLGARSQALVTVPTIGWTPKWEGLTVAGAREKRWGFSIARYGPQRDNECSRAGFPSWCTADAGDGTCLSGPNCSAGRIVGNDPRDTSEPITPAFVADWVDHIVGNVGLANRGGVRYYALDNEPMLWHHTHRDVRAEPLGRDELWARTVAIASVVKARDRGAKILGPGTWGYCDLFGSAADADGPGPSCTDGPDRAAHGGLPLVEWYLQKVCEQPGRRLVDYLDLHYYPQGNCITGSGCDGEDATTSADRLESLKELYDPAWISESWLGASGAPPVRLIPQVREWIARRCPGTGLAITEYNWGTDDGPSAALAQAEVLAIFGREGVDLATRWVAPVADSATEDAFRFYLDHDPTRAGFQKVLGDSVRTTSAERDTIGAYAVAGAAGKLWVLLFNHGTVENTARVSFAGARVRGPAPLFRFLPAAAAGSRLIADGTVPVGTTLEVALPARTAAMAVVTLRRR
jgi:hypothetical protein